MVFYTPHSSSKSSDFIIDLAHYLKLGTESCKWVLNASNRKNPAETGYATFLIGEAISLANFEKDKEDFCEYALQLIRKMWI